MEIGELISRFRKEADITIDELAMRSGVPKGTINKIISGTTKSPTLDNMKSIANALGKRLSDFDDPISSNKITPLYSNGALKLARDFDTLDSHGKAVVRGLMDEELNRVRIPETNTNTIAPAKTPKMCFNNFINPPPLLAPLR